MKILITSDLYTTQTNGVVTSIRNLTDELVAMGHEVCILSFSDTEDDRKKGSVYLIGSISLEKVYPGLRMPTQYRHPFVEALILWKPDVIHSQCEFFSYTFAKQISKRTGAPIVHTYHALYEQYTPYLLPVRRFGEYLVKMLSRRRLKSAAAVIAPTNKVKLKLKEYGVAAPISVVPTGLRLERHRERFSANERARRRSCIGIKDDQIVLINLGRMGIEKNIGELIYLFAMALTDDDRLILLLVGDGPDRKKLEECVKDLGISDHVIFTGMVAPTQVSEYYQLGDIFVCASTSESQGLTYVEAAANGLPLLCRRDPCLDNVLVGGKNGFSYSGVNEFLDSLQLLTDDEELRCGMGHASAEIAEKFNCTEFARSVEMVYRNVINK